MADAVALCNEWKTAYNQVRHAIEQKDHIARWEFDRRILFRETDYVCSVCGDIQNVAATLEEFFCIIGPELKSVTRDPQKIDGLIAKLQGELIPFIKVCFCACRQI